MGFSRQEYWSGVPLPSPDQAYVCLLPCGGLELSSLISGIPDSFSYAHHWKSVLSFKRNLASLGAAELLCLYALLSGLHP
ncbi:hypothetical protein K5549_014117 [Capra hircus]|nr:hypothetical protein K5549_014117 [Capra hircus]